MEKDEMNEKELNELLQRPKFRLVNPVTATRRALARRKVKEERRLLRREELMKQDAERYLMELEERLSWMSYELKERNLSRMIKEENVRYMIRKEEKNEKNRLLQLEKEEGLSYFRGQITEYRRWQNSPAKHLDITGHEGPVSAVRISPCLKYIASCSWDNTAKVWSLKSGKCLITLKGHKKKVNDIGIHPNFAIDSEAICLVTCSSDCTINLWNCVSPKPIKTITGHTEAVYKCSFSPDGRRIVSCSEDQTARIWCLPEGYLLYVFKAHLSPVSTAKFSPTGKYLVTGSDYGERRLMLWDASFPHFNSPVQFPHFIYWTPDGLIKKILIRKEIPNKHFWMTQKQLGLLDENEMVETWPGENATLDEIDSESDDSANDDDDEEGMNINDDDFGKDDIREDAGATVLMTAVDKHGVQSAATEYIAGGGTLVLTLQVPYPLPPLSLPSLPILIRFQQSYISPIAEAFVSVNTKGEAFDSFSEKSGIRVGTFQASAPIPWRPFITDPLNIRPPYRQAPKTVKETCNSKAFQYKEIRQFNRFTGEEILSSTAVEMLWNCPPPNLGPVVVTVNLRLRNEKFWRKLTYSLKESPIRMNAGDDEDEVNGEDGERYLFNQEERHDIFWSFIREQNWDAVESFFEKKCALFFEHRMFIRKRRILQFLKRIFSTTPPSILPTIKRPYNKNNVEFKHLILVWPFIHLPGQTRSSVLVEDVDIFPDNKSNQSFQSFNDNASNKNLNEEKSRSSPTNLKLKSKDTTHDKNLNGSQAQTSATSKESKPKTKNRKSSVRNSTNLNSLTPSLASSPPPNSQSGGVSSLLNEAKESDLLSGPSEMGDTNSIDAGTIDNPIASVTSDTQAEEHKADDSDEESEEDEDGDDEDDDEDDSSDGDEEDDDDEEEGSSDDDEDEDDEEDDSSDESKDDNSSNNPSKLPAIKEERIDKTKSSPVRPAAAAPHPSTATAAPAPAPASSSLSLSRNQHTTTGTRSISPSKPHKSNSPHNSSTPSLWNRFVGSFLYHPKASTTAPPMSKLVKEKRKNVNLLTQFFQKKQQEGQGHGVTFDRDIFDSDSDDNSDDSNTSSPHQRSKLKKKNKKLLLPKIIYTQPIEGKSFQSKVNKLATEEANLVSNLEFLGYSVAEECREYTTRGYSVEDMREIGQVPHWLQQHEKIVPVGSIPEDEGEGRERGYERGQDRGQEGVMNNDKDRGKGKGDDNLLRDGRYGPRYEGLDMPLPVNYPITAGLAKDALENNLKKDRKAKEIIEKNRIPTTVEVLARKEAAERRVWIPTPKWLKQRQKRREKRRQIEVEVGMNLMLSSSYSATRRESLISLPGMNPHYPNPSYELPAKLPPNYIPKEEKKKLFSNFFKKKKNVLNIQISEPVGRKSTEYSSQYQQYLQSLKEEELKQLKQKEEEERLLRQMNEEEEEEKEKKSVEGDRSLELISIEGIEENQKQDLNKSLDEDQSKNNSITTKTTNRSIIQPTPTPAAATPAAAAAAAAEESLPEPPSQELQLASYSHERRTTSLFTNKSSHEPYLDRRGSYLVAPGLESFSKYLEEKKNPLKKIKFDEYGRPINSLRKQNGTKGGEGQVITPRQEIKAPGLIRIMNTNGFDIAHQGTIFDAIFSPSENRIVSCGGDSLIKIWDPRDGSFVRRLTGHTSEVTALCFSANELYLVSGGGDQTILIWDMTTFEVTRTLRGHADVVNGLAASHDFTFIVSCSYDNLIKTWFLTPRNPDAPLAPKIITTTKTSIMISWQAPPSFNEPITAFEIQFQIPGQDDWGPNPAITVPPHYRQKTILNLSPATTYQFRLRATNRMGVSDWGAMSKYVTTKLGVPLKLPRPDICELTSTSITLFFFVPNPKIFGASPKTIIFNKSGEGKDFDDDKKIFTLEECLTKGEKLVESFRYWSSEEGQKKRRKLNRSKNKDDQKGYGLDIPLVLMKKTLEQCESVDTLLVSATIDNLSPGLLYRFRVCGVNVEGEGEWSDSSYSQATLPSIPMRPTPPRIEKKELTWILFKWDPPPDNGSALVGYRVFVKHLNYQFDLPRWQNTYRITHLTPGQSYYLKVLAKNAVGWSEYSDYNSQEEATTATAPPDSPQNPQAIDAEWGTMTLSSILPYDNGMPIHQFHIQHRVVQAFSKGIWQGDLTFLLESDEVQIVENEENEDDDEDERKFFEGQEEEDEEKEDEKKDDGDESDSADSQNGKKQLLKGKKNSSKKLTKKSSSNMLPSRKRITRMATGKLELTKETINTHIDKPKGKKIIFTVPSLQSDTLYEFRICYENKSGRSDYSIPSQRAKTKRAQVPDKMKPPRYVDIMPSYLNITFHHPLNGGDEILFFMIKLEDQESQATQLFRVMSHATEYRIDSLIPGGRYRICILAQNRVGDGEYSNWTQIVTLPKDIHEIMIPSTGSNTTTTTTTTTKKR